MLERLTPGWRNVTLALIGALLLWFCWTVRSVLNPLIFGYFLAFVVHPLVLSLERRGWRRTRAVNLIFFLAAVGGALLSITLFVQGRMLVRDLAREDGLGVRIEQRVETFVERHEGAIQWLLELVEEETDVPVEPGAPAPEGGGDAQAGEEPAPPGEGEQPQGAPGDPVTEGDGGDGTSSESVVHEEVRGAWQALAELWQALLTQDRVARAGEVGLRAAGRSFNFLQHAFGSLLGFLSFVLLLPVYTYFLLFEMERIHRFVKRYIPRRERARISRIGVQIGEVLSNFFRGRLLVCLLKGLVLAAGLAVAGVDYAFLIGIASGFLALVPFVGAFLGAVAAFLLGLMEHSVLSALIRVVIVFGITELIEGYVLIPKVLGDTLGLHPVVVLVSIFVGGATLGMFGFLIALPLTATLIILARELVLPALAAFADEDG